MIIIISLLVLSAVAKSQCDRKAFKEGGVETSSGKGWLLKVPLSMFLGKWHFWDFVRVYVSCAIVSLALTLPEIYYVNRFLHNSRFNF